MQVSLLDESIQPKTDGCSLKTGGELEKLARWKTDKAKSYLNECVFEWQEEEHNFIQIYSFLGSAVRAQGKSATGSIGDTSALVLLPVFF